MRKLDLCEANLSKARYEEQKGLAGTRQFKQIHISPQRNVVIKRSTLHQSSSLNIFNVNMMQTEALAQSHNFDRECKHFSEKICNLDKIRQRYGRAVEENFGGDVQISEEHVAALVKNNSVAAYEPSCKELVEEYR